MDDFLSSDSDSSELSNENENNEVQITESFRSKLNNYGKGNNGNYVKTNINNKSKNMNYKSAGILSRLTFYWAKIALTLSKENRLSTSDLSTLHETQTTSYHYNKIKKIWDDKNNRKSKYALLYCLFISNIKILFINLILEATLVGDDYLNMYFTNKLIYQFSNYDTEKGNKSAFIRISFIYAICLCASKIYRTFAMNHGFFLHNIISERITNQVSGLLYTKILRCNTNANIDSKEEGEKINLVCEDCEKIGFIFGLGVKMILSPFRIIISIYWLFRILGISVVFSICSLGVILALIMLIQWWIVKNFKIYLEKKDSQMKEVVNDLQNIKSIKINGMESFFLNRIYDKKNKELKYFGNNLYLGVIRNFLSSNCPLIMRVIAISVFIYNNNNIEVSNLFTIINLIGSISIPLLEIPVMLTGLFQNLFSITRIQDFLYSPEHDYSTHENLDELNNNNIRIKYDNVTFGISSKRHISKNTKDIKLVRKPSDEVNLHKDNENNSDSELNPHSKEEIELKEIILPLNNTQVKNDQTNFNENLSMYERVNKIDNFSIMQNETVLLNNISIEIKTGEFVGILGPTGSGKTCLINSILNNYEIFHKNSDIIINGSISFQSQQAFIINATVKNNILFDSPFNQERYDKVVKCCQLLHDFELFNKRDELLVSQNGANLSGGQKARVSLCRCLYQDADIYLLDDPLANIDAKISRKILQYAFKQFLDGKTRILSTNEITDISIFDKIIIMDKGSIVYFGTPKEYKQTSQQIRKDSDDSLINIDNKNQVSEDNNKSKDIDNTQEQMKDNNDIKIKFFDKKMSKYSTKSVPFSMYNTYIKLTGGYIWFISLIVFIIISQISRMQHQKYLANWSKTSKQIKSEKRSKEQIQQEFWSSFKIFIIYNLGEVIFKCIADIFRTVTILVSISTMFKKMLLKLIKAPINLFHDLCPIGHIINRLSRDLNTIQRIIFLVNFFCMQGIVCSTSFYMCYEFNSYSLFIIPPIIIVSFILTCRYLPAARGLQRLHRTTFSPVLTLFSEGIKGVETIRTLKKEEKVTKKIFKKLDNHYGIHLYIEGAGNQYSILLHALIHIFYCIEVIYLVINIESFNAKVIGLLLQQLNIICFNLSHVFLTYKELEVMLISLERCESYDKIPCENEEPNKVAIIEDEEENDNSLDSSNNALTWPSQGKIQFIDYSTKYRKNLPLVLNNINLIIEPGQKIGIVGRTGSGKSTLVLGLSRILEPHEGTILIDDTDISKINITTLRRHLTIVAQEPFINEGTLKSNLDPLSKYTDEELIEVMNDFCIKPSITMIKDRFNFMIKINGQNISIGERQLICFARAALMKNKIVILDEATSSLDTQTEEIIRKNMIKYFKDKTVLIIAHQINMVSDCDKIMVIDDHKIVEFDTYNNLMNNKKSKFYELYKENHALDN